MTLPQFEDIMNPDVGWIIAPLAVATKAVEDTAQLNLMSVPEMLYGFAAVLYATAAIIKSRRNPPKHCGPHCQTCKSSMKSNEPTIDLKTK